MSADTETETCVCVPSDLLRSTLLILHFIHGPHGTLDILHPYETLVQTEIVSHRVL